MSNESPTPFPVVGQNFRDRTGKVRGVTSVYTVADGYGTQAIRVFYIDGEPESYAPGDAPFPSSGALTESDALSLLMQYSEWLDVENIQIHNDDDGRTHEDLVRQFMTGRNVASLPKIVGA